MRLVSYKIKSLCMVAVALLKTLCLMICGLFNIMTLTEVLLELKFPDPVEISKKLKEHLLDLEKDTHYAVFKIL